MPTKKAKVKTSDVAASEPETVLIDLAAIDGDTRPARLMRALLDSEAIEEYAEKLDDLPPIRLVYEEASNTYWVVDGSHRINAAWTKGVKQIRAVVQPGTYLEAFALATRVNDRNGVRITTADKQKRVKEAHDLEMVLRMSTRLAADFCNVSQSMITQARQEPELSKLLSSHNGQSGQKRKVQGRDGKVRRYPATRPAPPKQPATADAELEAEIKLLMELREAVMKPIPKPEPEPEEEEEEEEAEPEPRIDPAKVAAIQQKLGKMFDHYLSFSTDVYLIGGIDQLKEGMPSGQYEAVIRMISMIKERYDKILNLKERSSCK